MAVDLSDVQGNILKGFNKLHVRLIFFKFGDDPVRTMKWLSEVANNGRIPSTKELLDASKKRHEKMKDPGYMPQDTWLHVSLSKNGINSLEVDGRRLRLPPSRGLYEGVGKKTKVIPQFSRDAVTIGGPRDPFRDGMKSDPRLLGDIDKSAPENWDEPFKRDNNIDALFVVASDQDNDLESYVLKLIEIATVRGATCVGLEVGKAIRNEQGKQVEHFGFRDGISQPLVIGVDNDDIQKRGNYTDRFYPEDFVLFGLDGDLRWANNGSFLVFRKLEQDVPGFWDFIREKCEKHEIEMSPEEFAAKLVGRWKSGAPLAERQFDPVSPEMSDSNDFRYVDNESGALAQDDSSGRITPTFAHIRLANSRDGHADGTMQGYIHSPHDNLVANDQHRILRRGISYGPKWAKDIETGRSEHRGMLFMCYQRDIKQQFEFIQGKISHTEDWPADGPHGRIVDMLQKSGYTKIGIEHWVITKGGEYFFSPSISALKQLQDYLV